MSLSGALSNALSGLTANSRAASLVASNISNATTESYGRRVLETSSRSMGTSGGVWIDGVVRQVDTMVLSDRRLSDAQNGFAGDMQTFASQFEQALGQSDEAGSLIGRYYAFENALISAASNPQSTQRLNAVSLAANDFVNTINTLANQLNDARSSADQAIADQVTTLNDGLHRVDQLNSAIQEAVVRGGDPSSLMDERQRVIDGIAPIVPLRTISRDNGMVAVYAASGTPLLDPTIHGEPVTIEFQAAGFVAPDSTITDATLSGLELNGFSVDSSNSGPLGGGTLGAQFQIRDVVALDMQSVLDGISRDLVDRFSAGGADTTIVAGDPGLFTDQGLAFDPLNETGLASRIALNILVAPGTSEVWRLRDGLGAATEGAVGDARLLQAFSDALGSLDVPGSTSLGSSGTAFAQHLSNFHSEIASARVRADGELTFTGAQNTALKELELSKGVDTDAELQDLMKIEQHYAANARVVTTIDDLMQTLLSI